MAKKNRTKKNRTIKRTKNKKNTKNNKRIKRKSKILKKRGGGGVKCPGYNKQECGNYYYSWLNRWYNGEEWDAKYIPTVHNLILHGNEEYLCPECAKRAHKKNQN